METMADILRGKIDIHAHCYRSDEMLMLLNLGDELGFKVRELQHVLEGYKVGREIARHGAGADTTSEQRQSPSLLFHRQGIVARHGDRLA